jgi:hypothetical protein
MPEVQARVMREASAKLGEGGSGHGGLGLSLSSFLFLFRQGVEQEESKRGTSKIPTDGNAGLSKLL